MFCERCGNALQDGERFCRVCGTPVTNVSLIQNTGKASVKHNSVAQNLKGKKILKKKLLIPLILVAVIVIVAAVLGINNYMADKPIRDMEKAFESKDVIQVIAVIEKCENGDYYKCNSSEKVRETLWKNINSATNTFNNEFVYDEQTFDENDILESVIRFIENRFGTLYYIDGVKSEIWNIEEYMKSADLSRSYGGESNIDNSEISTDVLGALNDLDRMIDSKIAYYCGLSYLNNSDDSRNYCKAIEKFSAVIEDDLKYNDAVEKGNEAFEIYFKDTIEAVDEYMKNGDYSAATSLLDTTFNEFSNSDEYSEAITAKSVEIRKRYADEYVQKADESFKSGDVNAAIGNMQAALTIQPENSEYKSKLELYFQYLPYPLYIKDNTLKIECDDAYWGTLGFDKNMKSNDNQSMEHSISWYNNNDTLSSSIRAVYNLEGKYDTLSGIIFLAQSDKDSTLSGYFEVYGDGKLLFTSSKISAGVLPQSFEVNVTGIQKLQISFHGIGTGGFLGSGPEYGVNNLVVQKNYPE